MDWSSAWNNFTKSRPIYGGIQDASNWFVNAPFAPSIGEKRSLAQITADWGKGTAAPQAPSSGLPQGGGGQPSQAPLSLSDILNLVNGGSGGGGGSSGGSAAAAVPDGYYTPDGVFVQNNSAEDVYYKMADAVWTRVYGAHPPYSIVRTFHDMGLQNTDQLQTVMMEMPSHIKGADGQALPLGQVETMKSAGQKFADQYFGRPVPDSLLQDWASKGITSPESIELWFVNHPAKDIPKDQYGAIFDAGVQFVQGVWNTVPHPNDVHAIYSSLNGPSVPGAGIPAGVVA